MYRLAPDVAQVAAPLVSQHHHRLVDAPIVYIFRDSAPRSRGRMVLGRARVTKGLPAFLAAVAAGDASEEYIEAQEYAFFVVEIAEDWWVGAEPGQRAAVVDHELCHLDVDDESGDLSLRGHDLEEFNDVVARHGLWRDDVSRFFGACGVGAAAACSVA
ncbi:MAG: hypothetical protein KY469_10715 [Actinobacteria bacterium]|nr:hypothetical protein [Actinomycetota bacterium]